MAEPAEGKHAWCRPTQTGAAAFCGCLFKADMAAFLLALARCCICRQLATLERSRGLVEEKKALQTADMLQVSPRRLRPSLTR